MSSTVIIAIIGVIVVIIGGVFFLSQSSPSSLQDGGERVEQVEEQVRRVPNLSFQDYSGNTVKLRDFTGTPLVVNSWAVWCPFCVKELADFAQVKKELDDQFVFIAVDRAESLELVKSFTDDLGVTDDLLFVLDPSDSFYRAIAGFSMPETIFVNRDGEIVLHKRGPMSADEFREKIQLIL
ncbi:TlpA family protein disulfide reductase [Patescibacteria group bacterium]|nr:TlpA family protein disulfide reductase [Patescibacteria group bacterium]